MSITYTHRERTAKDWTVQTAIDAAHQLLTHRYQGLGMCTNSITRMDPAQAISLEQVNDVVSNIINDSLYYGGRWM